MKNLILFIAICLPFFGWSFGKEINDVIKEIEAQKTPENQYKFLRKAIAVSGFEYSEELDSIAKSIVLEAKSTNNLELLNVARLCMAYNYQRGSKYSRAIQELDAIGDYYKTTNQYDLRIFMCVQKVLNYIPLGEYQKALNVIREADTFKKKAHDERYILQLVSLEGSICIKMEQLDRAEELFNKYMKEAKKLEADKSMARTYASLASIYQLRDQLDTAAVLYKKSAEYALRDGDLALLAEAQTNIGIVEAIKGNAKAGLELFEEALRNQRTLGNPRLITEALYNLGVFYFDNGDLKKAKPLFVEGLEIAKKHEMPSLQLDMLMELSNLSRTESDDNLALDYLHEYVQLQDQKMRETVISQEALALELSDRKLEALSDEYGVAAKRADSKISFLEGALKMSLFFGASTAFVLVLLLFRKKKQNRVNSTLEA